MEELMTFAKEFLSTGGWIGAYVFTVYLVYKTLTVSIVAWGILKGINLVVTAFTSRTLEQRIAAELGTKAPLTAGEEAAVLKAVRAIDLKQI